MSAHAVATAHGKEVARLRKLEATQRFKQATAAMEHAQAFIVELGELRCEALRELREDYGWSWAELADEFGTSRQRMAQIGTR